MISNASNLEALNLSGATVGGVVVEGGVQGWVLHRGNALHCLEFQMKKGFSQGMHNHPDHESIGYVISGKLEMSIDGVEYTLQAGDSWHHPRAVFHWTKAVEDSHVLEMHSPPREDFDVKSQAV